MARLFACGDRERARALYETVRLRAHDLPNERIEAMSLGGLATIAIDEGKVQEALPMLKASLRITQDLGDVYLTAANLGRVARALAVEGRAETATVVLSREEALNEQIGVGQRLADTMKEETLTNIRANLDEAAFAEAWKRGRALNVDEVVALAFDSSSEFVLQPRQAI